MKINFLPQLENIDFFDEMGHQKFYKNIEMIILSQKE
jgi:hypothetical protein